MKPHPGPLLALALAACSGEAGKESGGAAGGEILPASVSDAMLPYDTLRSQAPLAETAKAAGTVAKGETGDGAGADAADPSAAATSPEAAEPQPAAPADADDQAE